MLSGLRAFGRSLLDQPTLSRHYVAKAPWSIRGFRFAAREFAAPTAPVAAPAAPNPLLDYFDAHREGNGIFKWRHYFDIYHRHLARFVGREVHILEVGIYSGGSLAMWRQYFGPGCRVYGVDIENACKSYENEYTRILIGDQGDRGFWTRVRDEVPVLDILVDDGSHQAEHQVVTLEEMLPHLRPGGVFLCEDHHRDHNRFAGYVHGLADQLNAVDDWTAVSNAQESYLRSRPTPWQRAVASIHLYPFVTVIEKRAEPLDRLICEKHGTRWQPFI